MRRLRLLDGLLSPLTCIFRPGDINVVLTFRTVSNNGGRIVREFKEATVNGNLVFRVIMLDPDLVNFQRSNDRNVIWHDPELS